VIYLRNKDQQDALFPLNLFQIGTLIVLAASQRRCMINTISCIYSKIPPDDE
jgi:hypothetical protein